MLWQLWQPLRGSHSKYLLESIQTSIHFISINLEVSTYSTVDSQLDLYSNRYHRTNLQRQSHLTLRVLEFPHSLGRFKLQLRPYCRTSFLEIVHMMSDLTTSLILEP